MTYVVLLQKAVRAQKHLLWSQSLQNVYRGTPVNRA